MTIKINNKAIQFNVNILCECELMKLDIAKKAKNKLYI